MGMRPARMCSKCYHTAIAGGRFCSQHNALPDSRHRRGPLKKLYDCALWRIHTRGAILHRDPQCTNLINGSPCMRLSSDVHHVVDAEEWMALGNDFYDQSNLVGLCRVCHTGIRRGQRGK